MSTTASLFRHGVERDAPDGNKRLLFTSTDLSCVIEPGPTSPLREPLAEGEHWYLEIGKARYDDKPIPVEHDWQLAERRGENYEEQLARDSFDEALRCARVALEALPKSRERSLVETKLDEAELWFGRVKP